VTSHLDLLAIAARLRSAVERDDTEGFHAELIRLRASVMEHVHAEHALLDSLPGSTAAVVIDGQRRLLRLLSDVVFTPADPDGDHDCNCILRAAAIDLSLRRQAKLETTLLQRHPHARQAT